MTFDDPQSALAAIIVFDQFSRNMFRGQPRAFATDSLALFIARRCAGEGVRRSRFRTMAAFLLHAVHAFRDDRGPGALRRVVLGAWRRQCSNTPSSIVTSSRASAASLIATGYSDARPPNPSRRSFRRARASASNGRSLAPAFVMTLDSGKIGSRGKPHFEAVRSVAERRTTGRGVRSRRSNVAKTTNAGGGKTAAKAARKAPAPGKSAAAKPSAKASQICRIPSRKQRPRPSGSPTSPG